MAALLAVVLVHYGGMEGVSTGLWNLHTECDEQKKRNKGQLTTEPSLLVLPHHPCAAAIELPVVPLPAVLQLSCPSCCGHTAAGVERVGLWGLLTQQRTHVVSC